jgi:hypothetical protein
VIPGASKAEVATLVSRIGSLFQRSAVPDAERPDYAEAEAALADCYSCELALEAERWRIQKYTAELFARGPSEPKLAAKEIRRLSARQLEIEEDLGRLRALLAEVRDYAALLAGVATS